MSYVGADIVLDFAASYYRVAGTEYGSFSSVPNLAVSRTGAATAEDAAGLVIAFSANTARRTTKGLLVEEGRTNVVLRNRDLTNAAWTKSNVTAAKNQFGADGVSNSASSITATAANGTCLQAITLASSARFQTAYVKRITGSGTIQMTMDNGSTWTTVTVTSSWTRVSIPTQTLANPTVGFRIVTSGDAIAVDYVQNENGTFPTSAIETTSASATRGTETVKITGLTAPSGYTLYSEFDAASRQGAIITAALLTSVENDNNTVENQTNAAASRLNFARVGAAVQLLRSTTTALGGQVVGWDGSTYRGTSGGAAVSTGGSSALSWDRLAIGCRAAGGTVGSAYTKAVVLFPSWVGDSTAQAMSQYFLSVDPGAFAEAGMAAGLRKGSLVGATGGAYSLSEQAAGLLRGYALSAESGAFTRTGQDASLTYTTVSGETLDAEGGAFSVTGQAATLVRGRPIAADNGPFNLAGQDAALLRGRLLSAETGGFSLTGHSATLSVATPAVWDVLANMTLGNGDLTATGVGGGLNGNARSSLALTGKHYVELTYSGAGSNLPGCGVANASENNAPGTGDSNSVSWSTQFGSGGIFLNGTNLGSIGLWSTASDVLCIAVDRPNGLAWFRKNSGNWNGSGTANPATGVGGFDISALGVGDWYIYAYVATQTYAVTANFGGSAYAYTAPAGFGALGLAAYILTADSGAFSVAGQDAALVYGALGSYVLVADSGDFSLSGQDVTLRKGYKIGVQQIYYTVQGQQFAPIPRQTAYPGSTGDHIFVFGNEAYQGNRNTFAYPPEVDWPLRISDLGNIHRFEVRNGDKGFTGDDPGVVNRSEIVFWEAMAFDTDYVFSFAFYIENQERTLASIFHTLFQFHHEADAGDTVTAPPFTMTYAASDGNINFHHRTSTDDPLTVVPAFAFLGFASATPGQWMNVYIEVRWSPSGSGHYRVWVNGAQKVNYSGATGYVDAVAPRGQYGTYRSSTDQNFAIQFANMEWSAGSGLSGRLASPLPIGDASLARGVPLQPNAGPYGVVGQDAALRAGRSLFLAFGQFTLTGQDVSFRFSRVFQADAGAVVLQGRDANLVKATPVHRALSADAGVYLVVGKADLRGPPWTPVEPGPASWTATSKKPATWAPVAVNPETWTPQ